MNYNEFTDHIKAYFPNNYKKHYVQHAADGGLTERVEFAGELADELRQQFASIQRNGYTAQMAPSPVQLPPHDVLLGTELLTDYILAEDHVRGLKLQRDANEFEKFSDEFPPLGEGAQELLERSYLGVPLSIGEKRRVKECEVCRSEFIDCTKPGNAKVCGPTCRERKDAIRKRKSYNESELGLVGEARRKRDRQRQDYDYAFYNPYEMNELSTRSESSYDEDKLDRQAFKHAEDYAEWRLEGKRKPKFVGRDEFDDKKPFNYRPKGRNKPQNEADWTQKNGEVVVRKLSDITAEQLESEKFIAADKMRGVLRINPFVSRVEGDLGSEKNAIV